MARVYVVPLLHTRDPTHQRNFWPQRAQPRTTIRCVAFSGDARAKFVPAVARQLADNQIGEPCTNLPKTAQLRIE